MARRAHRGAVYRVAGSEFAVGLMRRDGRASLRSQTADMSDGRVPKRCPRSGRSTSLGETVTGAAPPGRRHIPTGHPGLSPRLASQRGLAAVVVATPGRQWRAEEGSAQGHLHLAHQVHPAGHRHHQGWPARLDSGKETLKALSSALKAFYVTMGRYDIVAINEAPDDETAAKVALAIGSAGNVTTETLRAFTEDEYRAIVAALP
jgi:uncharacterized protein with GYD domain